MATSKKATVKKTSHKSHKKPQQIESFKVSKETKPFVSYRITDQTIYWSILLILIFGLALWILQIQININDVLNSIKVS
jgi:inner membrane protein involved in colicin E2 resistance